MYELSHTQTRRLQNWAVMAGGQIYYDDARSIYIYARSRLLGGRTLAAAEIRSHQQYRCNNFIFKMPTDFWLLEVCLKHDMEVFRLHRTATERLAQRA